MCHFVDLKSVLVVMLVLGLVDGSVCAGLGSVGVVCWWCWWRCGVVVNLVVLVVVVVAVWVVLLVALLYVGVGGDVGDGVGVIR